MGKFSAGFFYLRALAQAFGVPQSAHHPSEGELKFAGFALANSSSAVECGPRTDSDLAALAVKHNVPITIFEASPAFASILKWKTRGFKGVKIENFGVSDQNGQLEYFLLNQSFIPNKPYPTFGINMRIQVTTLDSYFDGKSEPEFIKSDIEGFDLNAFKGAKTLLTGVKYFQLEMSSTDFGDYEFLRKSFDLFYLLDSNHPLGAHRNDSDLVPEKIVPWKEVSESMTSGNTVIMCGIRKGLSTPVI